MSRVGTALAIVGVVALAGATYYAVSRVDDGGSGESRNLAPPAERVRVEVLNAGGVSGQARAATDRLREIGFDVVSFGNAGTFDREITAVVDRVGRPELAQAVARVLGVEAIVSDPDPNLFVDVTVLLGMDWIGEDAAGAAAGATDREAWDPRAWIGR
jgi:hypothetical protein